MAERTLCWKVVEDTEDGQGIAMRSLTHEPFEVSDEMVERAAEALWTEDFPRRPWTSALVDRRATYLTSARAALAAAFNQEDHGGD